LRPFALHPEVAALATAWLDWLAHEKRQADATVKAYRTDLDGFLAFCAEHLGEAPDPASLTGLRAADFRDPKTLEDFDFAAQPGAERPLIQHLAQLAWIEEAANVCFLGPPGTGKTHLAIALAIMAFNPTYIEPLYSTLPGQAMLAGAAALETFGVLVIKKILAIEV